MVFANIAFDVTEVNKKVNKRSLSFATDLFIKGASSLTSAYATEDGSSVALSSGRNSLPLMKALKHAAAKGQKPPSQVVQRVYNELFFYCSLIFITLGDVFLTITSVGNSSYVLYKQDKSVELGQQDAESQETLGTGKLKSHKVRVKPNDLLVVCSGNLLNAVPQTKLLKILSAKEPALKKAQKLTQEIKAVSHNSEFTLLFCKISDNGAITNLHKIEHTPHCDSVALSASHGSSPSSQSSSSLDSNILTTPSSMRSLSWDSFNSSISPKSATRNTSNDEIESSFQEDVNEDSSHSRLSSATETSESFNDFNTLDNSSLTPLHSSPNSQIEETLETESPNDFITLENLFVTPPHTQNGTQETPATETESETVLDLETPENSSTPLPNIISNDNDVDLHSAQKPLDTDTVYSPPSPSFTDEATETDIESEDEATETDIELEVFDFDLEAADNSSPRSSPKDEIEATPVIETESEAETLENSAQTSPRSSLNVISNDNDVDLHSTQKPLDTDTIYSSPSPSLTEEATETDTESEEESEIEIELEEAFSSETTENPSQASPHLSPNTIFNDDISTPLTVTLSNTQNAIEETPEAETERASPCLLSISPLSSPVSSRLNTPSPSPSTTTSLDSLSLSPSPSPSPSPFTFSGKSFGSSSSSSSSRTHTPLPCTRKQLIAALARTVQQQIAAIHPFYARTLGTLSISGLDDNDEDFEVVINEQ